MLSVLPERAYNDNTSLFKWSVAGLQKEEGGNSMAEEHQSKVVKWGFGMAPLKEKTDRQNREAITQVKNFVFGNSGAGKTPLVDQISVVKGLFNRIVRQDQWDWFTVNMYFDYPTYHDMSIIVRSLTDLRKALLTKNDTLGAACIKTLKTTRFARYCDNYLNFDINVESKEEYIYILSRREEREILKIGMTTRNVQKRVNEINAATGVLYPLSARKVYKVKDARKAEHDIHELLDAYRIRADREFFDVPFGTACSIIEKYLKAGHQDFYSE